MKKKLFLSLFCMLALPFICSVSQNRDATYAIPFNTIAIAGRTLGGDLCQCGCPGCMCDPEEQAATCYGAVARDSSQTEDANETGDTGFDPASGVMLLALFFLVAARLRAY